MGFFDKLKDFVVDHAKFVAAATVMPINSVTGHQYNPKFKSDYGKIVGGTALAGSANINLVAKAFADKVTGGYVSSLVNPLRAKQDRESLETGYSESGIGAGNGNHLVDEIIKLQNKASVSLGSYSGAGNAGIDVKFKKMQDERTLNKTNQVVLGKSLTDQVRRKIPTVAVGFKYLLVPTMIQTGRV